MRHSIPVAFRLRRLVRRLVAVLWVVALIGPATVLGLYLVDRRIAEPVTPSIDSLHNTQLVMRWAQSDLRAAHHDAEGVTVDALIRVRTTRGGTAEHHWSAARAEGHVGPDELLPLELPEFAASHTLVVSDSTSALCPTSPEMREATRVHGPHAVVLSPVRIGRDRFGTLAVVDSRAPRMWNRREVETVDQVAAQLARTLFERHAHHTQRVHLKRLEELDRQKTEFISTVSHELRTPLASIAGYTEMLADGDAGELSDRQQRLLAVVTRNTGRLQGLIDDLLILNRIESPNLKVVREEVDLARTARLVAENLAPQAAKRDVAITVRALRPARVLGDSAQLERALTNLVGNAVKFSPSGTGRVSVDVFEHDGTVTARVRGNGIGIPADQQELAFDRFFRASNARSASIPGTGLGLSIVRAIAEGHRGTLTMESEEGDGSTFTLELPGVAQFGA